MKARQFWKLLLAVCLVFALMSGSASAALVGVNPSSQVHNQGADPAYIEGRAMKDLGERMSARLTSMGLANKIYWSGYGDYISGLSVEVKAANRDHVTAFIALHSDSAGSVTNRLGSYYYSDNGYRLGNVVGGHVARKLGMNFIQRSASFYVLRSTDSPAVLFEILNHSSPVDVKRLLDPQFRQATADAFAEGYALYVGAGFAPTPIPPAQPVPYQAKLPVLPRDQKNGAAVREVQDRLFSYFYYELSVDGAWGPETLRTVKAFQSDHRLTPDGVVGTATWTALRDKRTVPRTVGYGDHGRAVAYLQERLAKRYPGWHLASDGDFGPHTDSAVRIHQRLANLIEDGIAGEQVWRSLLAGER